METLRETRALAAAATVQEERTEAGKIYGRYLRGYRNGLPLVPYEREARTYPWALKAIAAAEAEHGEPFPVCLCGARLVYVNGGHGRCPACEPDAVTAGRQRNTARARAWRERQQDVPGAG